MLIVNSHIQIPDEELSWSFARSGGPGGQNVNKVSSKAVLRWDLANSPSLSEEIKTRFCTLQRRRITREGELVLSSQRYRDQDRNRQDCLDKLRDLLLEAAARPTPRKETRPTRGSQRRRLASKRQRSELKAGRRDPGAD